MPFDCANIAFFVGFVQDVVGIELLEELVGPLVGLFVVAVVAVVVVVVVVQVGGEKRVMSEERLQAL